MISDDAGLFFEAIHSLLDSLDAYMRALLERGYSEQSSERMVVQYHLLLMKGLDRQAEAAFLRGEMS